MSLNLLFVVLLTVAGTCVSSAYDDGMLHKLLEKLEHDESPADTLVEEPADDGDLADEMADGDLADELADEAMADLQKKSITDFITRTGRSKYS